MAAKGMAAGRTPGNGSGTTYAGGTASSHGAALEFERSINKAGYIDETPMPVVVIDCNHTIEFMNRSAALLAGCSPEACVGQKMWDVFDMQACRNGSCLASHAMREGLTQSGDVDCLIKGRKLSVRAYASPRYDDQNKVIGAIEVLQDNSEEQAFADELSRLVNASHEGQLQERGKSEEFQGRYRALALQINAMLDAILLPIGEGNRILAQISNGKIDELIAQTYKGDHEKMKLAVNNVAVVLQGLQKELARLTTASRDGMLSERGKPEQFHGAYAEVVGGVNQMLDAILLPIGEGNRILAQISNGKIDELIAQTYKGDHEKMKQAVNNVAVVLQGLQKELARLTDASRDGMLSERGKPEQFQGAYAEVVGGVNQMLDAILLPIGEGNRILAQISNGKIDELIAQTYKGDHEKMKQAVNTLAVVLQSLTEDTNMLTKAALEGKLSTRAECQPAPWRLPQDCRGRQLHARRGRGTHAGCQRHSHQTCRR